MLTFKGLAYTITGEKKLTWMGVCVGGGGVTETEKMSKMEEKRKKSETQMTASILKQDPNT